MVKSFVRLAHGGTHKNAVLLNNVGPWAYAVKQTLQ